jgi:hypothetical protein
MAKTAAPTIGLPAQLFCLAAGPAAWIAQLCLNYGLSSYACFPGDAPRATAPPASEHGVLLAISLVCLALALAGLWVSLVALKRSRASATGGGRSRFLAMCGVLSASAFAIAIGFDLPSSLALRLCWSIPQ